MKTNKQLNSIYINPNKSISFAIKQLEKSHRRILFILKDNKLLGVFEDSDLRRALIRKVELDDRIITIANLRPKFIYQKKFSQKKLYTIFKNYNCVAVPILNKKKNIVDIHFNTSIYQIQKKDNPKITAVIMAGGLGKRLRPLTHKNPKPMVKYKNKPILLKIINNLLKNKINKILISVHYKKNRIIEFVKKSSFKNKVSFIHEKKFLGTAGSLRSLKDKNLKNIFVINGDVITNLDILSLEKYHLDNKLDLTVVTKTIKFQIPYGMIETKNILLRSLEEKPFFTKSIVLGAYFINSKCLKVIPNKRFDMPDLISLCIKKKFKIGYYPTYEKYKHISSIVDLK
tara:strand:+ start:867 stop:1895 length:1029 start_codon:yes stop_codon:yes gene_type:complete